MTDAIHSSPLTIVIVDDHPVLAEGMAGAIRSQPDFAVVGIANTVESALQIIPATTPDIVLMDYVLPDGDGIETAAQVLQSLPKTKVIIVSGIRKKGMLERVIEVGCAGIIGKDGNTAGLFESIRAVARGETIVPSEEMVGLRGAFVPGEPSTGQALTAREYEILRHLAKLTPTEEIATELNLSIHTVRNHVRNILTKLGAHSKLEAVSIAVRDRILPTDAIG